MNNPKVAVVILNWNGLLLLKKFLPSVVNSTYKNLEIVVGDNASTDSSVDFIKENYPLIKVVVNDQNYGFAEGYNKVLAHVDADYLVLLNSDVEVTENWLTPIISLMESDKNIAIAQPTLRAYTEKNKFEYAGAAGGYIDKFGYPFCKGRIFDHTEVDMGQYKKSTEIFWASGAALVIKKEVWGLSGGFDKDLFAHMEEIDLCWRIKNLGYKVMSCPESIVYHVGAATLSTENPHKTYLNFRNNLIILQKNLPKSEAFNAVFTRFFLDFIAWLRFAVSGKFKMSMAISKAHYQFLKTYNTTCAKRLDNVKSLSKLTGVYNKSIVYAYFFNKIKKFSDLKF